MIEVAVAIDHGGRPIFWPKPEGSTAGSIPDHAELWYRIWDERERVAGVAHTHPGSGIALPSCTDETTFAAIEAGLGRKLIWPIVTMDYVAYFRAKRFGSEYARVYDADFKHATAWLETILELRRLSQGG